MTSVNIGQDNQGDAFYRYKMPVLQARVGPPAPESGPARPQGRCPAARAPTARAAQIEGRGNGIKTNVINNVDIAKALERPPECAPGRCALPGALPSGRAPDPPSVRCRHRQVVRLRAGRADQV